ncbi:MAG: Sir2 family NAD-dependent protein deacetylase [Devosia sp.]|nr:Sir2 family NAD-dependent protein deacetylase [Devosia sp.]
MLFVGAGVSMSVGLPSWQSLVQHMAEELNLPREIVDNGDVTYQTLAEFYRLQAGSIGPLRSWMDRQWHVSREMVEQSRLHKLIVELNFPVIYTTNYDRNLELAFDIHGCSYNRIANARDIAAAKSSATQIVKFHGDFDDDASLVLAETDYFNRLSFDSPLDVKFRADALGSTILFVGYSMSDVNIRLLLHRLWQTWAQSGYERDRPRSFVFMPAASVVQEAVLGNWGITMLHGQVDEPSEALTLFLDRLLQSVQAQPDQNS